MTSASSISRIGWPKRERQVAILEARLTQYQNALESIRSVAGKALDS
jgi:hypothetical protein